MAQIDDGCRSVAESLELLTNLRELGFSHVVATPHMRPGMFDNTHADLRRAFEETRQGLLRCGRETLLPDTSLGSEHFFDAMVVDAIHDGRGLPYQPDEPLDQPAPRVGGAILIEFHDLSPLSIIEGQLFRLQTAGFLPVIAHPERYRQVWKQPELVARLQDTGSVALLDSAALVGKYGRKAQECARLLLDEGTYHASCSDAHRPKDTGDVAAAMTFISENYGQEELGLLFRDGPQALLNGRRPASM